MPQIRQQDEVQEGEAILDATNDALARRSVHVSFPRPLERLYQQEVRNQHRVRTLAATIFALVAFYGITIPGISGHRGIDIALVLVGMGTALLPIAGAAIWLFARPLSMQRQRVMAAMVLLVTLSANIMMVEASAGHATRYAIGLVAITANVILTLNFRTAAFCSIAIWLITAAFVSPDLDGSWRGEIMPLLLVAAIAVLTLVANYRIETSSRYLFLLLLREKLQARGMRAENEQLSQISNSDPLTGIANRRAFDTRFAQAWRSAVEQSRPLALLLIDVDHFKLFNDTYGHAAGDECLRAVATALDRTTRDNGDFAARTGGEEFTIILANADIHSARAIARRIHVAVAALAIPHDASPTHGFVSISVGIAACSPADGGSPADLFKKTDHALYAAKAEGRNRTSSGERAAA